MYWSRVIGPRLLEQNQSHPTVSGQGVYPLESRCLPTGMRRVSTHRNTSSVRRELETSGIGLRCLPTGIRRPYAGSSRLPTFTSQSTSQTTPGQDVTSTVEERHRGTPPSPLPEGRRRRHSRVWGSPTWESWSSGEFPGWKVVLTEPPILKL